MSTTVLLTVRQNAERCGCSPRVMRERMLRAVRANQPCGVRLMGKKSLRVDPETWDQWTASRAAAYAKGELVYG